LTCLLISHWLQKMEQVGLPNLILPGVAKLQRNLSQEHELSLEFDGPSPNTSLTNEMGKASLTSEISLSVGELGCDLVFKSNQDNTQIKLTRKEAHAFLEMIAGKAKTAGWLNAPQWPDWLGKESR
jgi:hypothetical protein